MTNKQDDMLVDPPHAPVQPIKAPRLTIMHLRTYSLTPWPVS
jgi:hypothetical protein